MSTGMAKFDVAVLYRVYVHIQRFHHSGKINAIIDIYKLDVK